uniref:Uncharacterized protein n=1 Tax=Romanomermis culicivorax TaxID=13658 RepID=A0A915KJ39_ROMCU
MSEHHSSGCCKGATVSIAVDRNEENVAEIEGEERESEDAGVIVVEDSEAEIYKIDDVQKTYLALKRYLNI